MEGNSVCFYLDESLGRFGASLQNIIHISVGAVGNIYAGCVLACSALQPTERSEISREKVWAVRLVTHMEHYSNRDIGRHTHRVPSVIFIFLASLVLAYLVR